MGDDINLIEHHTAFKVFIDLFFIVSFLNGFSQI